MFWLYADEKSLFLQFNVDKENNVMVEQAQLNPKFPNLIEGWQPYNSSLPSNTLWFAVDEHSPNDNSSCILIGTKFYRKRDMINKYTDTHDIDCYDPTSQDWYRVNSKEKITLPSNRTTSPENFSKPTFPKTLTEQEKEWQEFQKTEQLDTAIDSQELSPQEKLFTEFFRSATCELSQKNVKTGYEYYQAWQTFKLSDDFKQLCNSTDRLDNGVVIRGNLNQKAFNQLKREKTEFFNRLIDEEIAVIRPLLGPEANLVPVQENQESTNENHYPMTDDAQKGNFLYNKATTTATDMISRQENQEFIEPNYEQTSQSELLTQFFLEEIKLTYVTIVIKNVSSLISLTAQTIYLTMESLETHYKPLFQLLTDDTINVIWPNIREKVANDFGIYLTNKEGILDNLFPDGLDSELFQTFIDSGQFMRIDEFQSDLITYSYDHKREQLKAGNSSSISPVSQSSSSNSTTSQLNDHGIYNDLFEDSDDEKTVTGSSQSTSTNNESPDPTSNSHGNKTELLMTDTSLNSQPSTPQSTNTISCDQLKTILTQYRSTSLLSHQPFSFFFNPLRSTTMQGLNKLATSNPTATISKKEIEEVIAKDRSYRSRLFTTSTQEDVKSTTGTDDVILKLKNYFNR